MFMKRLVSLLAAAALVTGMAGTAADVITPDIVYAGTGAAETAQADHSELIAKCTGDYAYKDLAKRENGAAMQTFYKRLYEAYKKVWQSDEDYDPSYAGSTAFYSAGEVDYSDLGLTRIQAGTAYYALMTDAPIFYYISKQYFYTDSSILVCLISDYAKGSYRAQLREQIYDYVTTMAAATEGHTRRYDKALILHDKMLPTMTYNNSDLIQRTNYSHNIIGAIQNKTGVCECYAETYQMLLNYVGVENMVVLGSVIDSNGKSVLHEWNAVKMDNGTYYFVDVTWDDKRNTHAFFAKGYTKFNEKHVVKASDGVDADYFYQLPAIPDGDYSSQANDPTLYNQTKEFSFYIEPDNSVTILSYLGNSSKVTIPPTILGFPVKKLGSDSFLAAGTVTEFIIPEGVETIDRGALFHALLSGKQVTIPKSVKSIGDYAFGWRIGINGYFDYDYSGDYSNLSPVKINGFTIYCYKDTAGYRYAVNNGFDYVLLEDEEEEIVPGDADGNGSIDVSDVLLIQQYLAGWEVKINERAANVDGSEKVDVSDVLLIQQKLAGWDVDLKIATA